MILDFLDDEKDQVDDFEVESSGDDDTSADAEEGQAEGESGEASEASEGSKEAKSEAVQDGEVDRPKKKDGFQKRIDELTRQKREAERQADAAFEYARAVAEENKKYKERTFSVAETAVTERDSRLTSDIEFAKRSLKDAKELGDTDKEIDAQERLASLLVEKERLKDNKVRLQAEKEHSERTPPQEIPQRRQGPDPKAQDWASRNQWFGKDKIMTSAAWVIHQQLVENGVDPNSDDYYTEIDRQMKKEFPHKYTNADSASSRKNAQTVVNGATRKTPASERRTTQLSPSQRRVADRLGLTDKQYLEALNQMEA